ncbi:LysR substrate-binding domain-containing protein [Pinirhizobacter soli]|uniref:LysR substrate-binding domain-containing protein n=1 Tax=Pinirhizobacter soli TaxID=2786953 RepID=UPI00202A6297|nr:LysR substrate-binding domain-containing protein [Pinirhizobacter soli]
MKHALPPMHTLRTFEALARLRNFARTAEELHLTPSAISHQIKALEAFYSSRLFLRSRRDVTPTPAGMRLLDVVARFLDELSDVGRQLRVRHADRLSLTAPPSLASRWLLPRLGQFLEAHPSADFKLRATFELVDLDAEDIDAGIRFGSGRWHGLRAQKLFAEAIFPVASPHYVESLGIRRIADLKRGVFLRDDFQSWDVWFARTRTSGTVAQSGPVFDDSALLLQAAEAGQGIALARAPLVTDAIAAGKLVRIGRVALASPGGYYLVTPIHRADSPMVKAFRQWLAGQ